MAHLSTDKFVCFKIANHKNKRVTRTLLEEAADEEFGNALILIMNAAQETPQFFLLVPPEQATDLSLKNFSERIQYA